MLRRHHVQVVVQLQMEYLGSSRSGGDGGWGIIRKLTMIEALELGKESTEMWPYGSERVLMSAATLVR